MSAVLRSPTPAGRRRGFTLIESAVVVVLAGILLALAVSRFSAYADRLAVRGAVGEAVSVFAAAREQALARRTDVAIVVDTALGAMRVSSRGTGLLSRELRAVYGVRLVATRDSMVYDARGLGHGAANLRLVARRGAASDTLFVSRLGRVRRAGSAP